MENWCPFKYCWTPALNRSEPWSVIRDGGSCSPTTHSPFQTYMKTSDGRKLNLSCTYSDSSQTIHWYRQQPNQTVQFIVSGYSSGVKSNSPEGVLLVAGDRKSNVFSFNKVTLEDSAVYYCALSDTVLHPGVSAV
uniref:Ig-like domain-containing protein n=1 Tax=Podarcis muralis TaxID=64176 RepID=A0A670JDD5_PODMU